MASNFEFLNRYWPVLYQIGSAAESYLFSDANACIYKLGMLGERIVEEIFIFDHLPFPKYDDSQAERVRVLKREGILPANIDDILFALRKARNDAVHNGLNDKSRARQLLKMSYRLCCWFYEVYGDWGFIAPEYIEPKEEEPVDWASVLADSEAALADSKAALAQQQEKALLQKAALDEKEQIIAELMQKLETVQTAASEATKEERKQHSEAASVKAEMTEAETRMLIDEQLRDAGWEADTENLRYSKGTRPVKGRNIAIAEWPIKSDGSMNDRADYALFIGLQMVGIVEAKRIHKNISAILDNQCRQYAMNIREEDQSYVIGTWNGYQVPFLFAANGRKYLKQVETMSGIWFRDVRKQSNIGKALQGWYSPDGLLTMLNKNTDEADQKLENLPYDLLRDPDGLGLRDYQIKAIMAAEKAILEGKDKVLISMATGTGKTRTILGFIYRMLVTGRFHRILFLVDRNSLGTQAQDVFKEAKIAELMTLDNLYNIKELGEGSFDKETRVQIATVQSLVRRILNENETGRKLNVSDYDLIIVDEAHRGYTLDREMSKTEMLYRDQYDYISKYRMVIEWFDAIKVAMTATPALHTSQIFGKPVFTYSYREAVIDGWLVDHDAPHNIMTKLRQEGIQYKRGDQIVMVDPVTGELLNGDELEDDLKFDVDAFNRKVITESFNRTVFTEICKDLNPFGDGKTLVFAVDDQHADLIVEIIRDIYKPDGVPPEAIRKITGSIGDRETVQKAIREFKNEKYPNIAVTVDLLTTGIDVPEITTLVFMVRIRSRILFEQMLGRATRLCKRINKTHFEIYDPVGVYESLTDVTNMKAVSPSATFEELLEELTVVTGEEETANTIAKIIAKLRRKSRRISEEAENLFVYLMGSDLRGYADQLHVSETGTAKASLLEDKTAEALTMLDHDKIIIANGKVVDAHEDSLISHTRGYGKGQKPEDYIESFKQFILTHMNEIEALKIVCTKPSDLTREGLRSLKMELDRQHYDERQLRTAWKDMTNQDIAADIIAFIRQQAIGSTLISHEERVKHAFARLKQAHEFTAIQRSWLDRIEKTMLQETVLDESLLNDGAFRRDGGFTVIDKRFGGGLKDIINELNGYIYDDGGSAAL